MSEVVIKDSAIKLFGRTISLPRNNNNNNEVSSSAKGFSSDEPAPPEDSSSTFPREVSSTTEHEAETDKEPSRKELTSAQEEAEEASHQTTEELKSPTSSSCNLEDPKTPSTERETSILKSSKNGDQSDTTTTTTSPSQDKTLKKPDKVLPCPRCNSMDTKFCYYNNYNVNQPRHFCKNCQRYWTAGGTMRNVPVGAGRRKNKNTPSSLSHFRQIMVPESLQNGSLHGASVLTFGSDSPLSDSMASVLSLAEKTTQNGFHSPNGDEYYDTVMASTLSERRDNPTTSTNSREESLDNHNSYHHHHHQGFTPQLCFPGSSSSPWPYPWNNPIMTPSAFCHPVPFYPTQAFWGSMPPPSWSVNYQSAAGSGPNSPTLGKHSRDGDVLFQKPSSTDMAANNNNNTVLIPKTLRIDDPTEAAKSSIWSTLGIKNEKGNSLDGGRLFKAFASKGNSDDKKNHVMMVEASPSPMLQANPAALSRSLVFHERT